MRPPPPANPCPSPPRLAAASVALRRSTRIVLPALLASLLATVACLHWYASHRRIKLSWEQRNHPERKAWSAELLRQIEIFRPQLELGNPDALVPGYKELSPAKKTKFWAELLVVVSRYESDWSPDDVTHEPPPLNVNSIGLLQLSAKDALEFNLRMPISSEEQLKDPKTNIDWAVEIFAHLVTRDRVVAQNSGKIHLGGAAYWSVLRGGKKFERILAHVRETVPIPSAKETTRPRVLARAGG